LDLNIPRALVYGAKRQTQHDEAHEHARRATDGR
jgi:hypothetical protein